MGDYPAAVMRHTVNPNDAQEATMFKKLALLTAGAVVLAACGGAAATTTTTASSQDATQTESGHDESFDRTVEITMGGENEFSFAPATVTVAAGETIRFVVTNKGQIEHEFRPTTVEEAQAHIESGHADHEEEGDEAAEHEEGEVLVQPGETKTLDVHFDEAGEYAIYACLLPGHYESGMVGDFTYKG